jgi:hypothetical protein
MLSGKGAAAMLIRFDRKGSFVAMDTALNFYEVVITEERVTPDNTIITPQQFLHTLDGKTVKRERKGQYVIVDSGVVIRSNDPACP